jgi:D-alanyl-D-alanine carboxypeptidase
VSTLERVCSELVESGASGALAFAAGPDETSAAVAGAATDGRGLRADDPFRTGSVTKTAVAALVLLLVEDGAVSLEDRATRWVDVPRSITIRHLLQHTSGLPEYVTNPAYLEPFLRGDTGKWRAEELIRLAGPPETAPGSFSYANTNYVALGLVAEGAGDSLLGEQLTRRVFEPLGMLGAEIESGGGAASGGLVATAGDVALLLRGLLSGQLLAPTSLEAMLTTVTGDGVEFARYGLGIAELDSFLGLVSSSCGSAWGHLGLMPGTTCAALSTRDGSRQLVVMATGPVSESFGVGMWEAFCGR